MKIKSGSLDPDPDLFFVNTGQGVSEMSCFCRILGYLRSEQRAVFLKSNNSPQEFTRLLKFNKYSNLWKTYSRSDILYLCPK
jgi:hypothetical protein